MNARHHLIEGTYVTSFQGAYGFFNQSRIRQAGKVDAVQMKQQLLNHGMELTAMRAAAHAARWGAEISV
jgi:hypothetical protein